MTELVFAAFTTFFSATASDEQPKTIQNTVHETVPVQQQTCSERERLNACSPDREKKIN